jgi:hypothetical protein
MMTAWALASIGIAAWGIGECFAYMMSSSPVEAEKKSDRGCLTAVAGILSLMAWAAVWWNA